MSVARVDVRALPQQVRIAMGRPEDPLRLEVTYPADVSAHTRVQKLYFDDDYTNLVVGK